MTMHLAKQIFKKISALLHLTELQCYTLFLDNALDFRLDLRSLSNQAKTDVNLAKHFYGSLDDAPKFFNFMSCFDWARLNNNIMSKSECLCLYIEKITQSGQKKYIKVYDESCVTRLFQPTLSITRHIFLLTKDKGEKKFCISYLSDKSNWHIYPEISETEYILHRGKKCIHISECLNDILKLIDPDIEAIPNCSFDELTSNMSLLNHIDRPLVICSHTGSKLTMSSVSSHRAIKPKKMHFSSLATFNEKSSNEPLVLCITLPQDTDHFFIYQPQKLISKEIINSCIKCEGGATGINEYLKDVANKTEKIENNKKNEFIEKWWSRYICRCQSCKLAKNEYANNVSLYGPQQRAGINLDTVEYLIIFNLKTDENIRILLRVYELTVAAVDLESFTKKTQKMPIKVKKLSCVGERSKTVGVQEISLIGYGDSFLKVPHLKIFDVIPGRKPARSVVDSFVGYILERQKIIEIEKEMLLQPLFDFINSYKEAHNSFWLKEFENETDRVTVLKTIFHSHRNSLVGNFEQHLVKLKKALYCFSFNGSRYDHILLHKFMAASLKLRGLKKPLHIIKRDSRIIRLTIPRSGIRFVDICDAIGPGSSLSSFAKLTGQKEEKMIFPFSSFDSIDFLKLKSLPSDRASWFNDLKQEFIPDTDIEKAHSDFKANGAKNIGEYLKTYLKMDVKLLGYGVITYFLSLFKKHQVHPLDIDKTTIASYSAYLYQHNLMKNKRIAHFSPNLLPLYGCLKSASSGGLTMVMRHSADGSDHNEAPINSHLSKEHNIRGRGVAVFDVSSLYPSSALFELPFGPAIFTFKCKDEDSLCTTKTYDKHSQKLMNSTESQVVQYLTLVRYPSCLRAYSQFHAGPGQVCYSKSFKKRVDLFLVLRPGVFKIVQYHDTASHVNKKNSHDPKCRYNRDGEPLDFNADTRISDDQNTRYAQWITEKVSNLTLTYDVYNECDFFHDNLLAENSSFTSPIEYLRTFHPKDSIFKPKWLDTGRAIDSAFLLDKIINTSECDSSFVVVKAGAKEDANDEVSKLFGFCLQRNSPTVEELGKEAMNLAIDMARKKTARLGDDDIKYEKRLAEVAKKYMIDRLKNKFTLTRNSFVNDQCLPVAYFKFLVEKRKLLKTVKILHYLHYEGRDYSTSYIKSLLQSRHDLIFAGLGKSLSAQIGKLIPNTTYGGFLMEQNKYHKFTYALGENLREKSIIKATNICLITAIPSEKNKISLMYLLKYLQSDKKISNLLQVGATILGFSRVIFYSQIYSLLSTLDSRKAELCYCDTDSMMLFLSSPNLNECVKKEKSGEFKEISNQIFVDPTSTVTQAGRLKLEGFYESGFFRCIKSYVLNPFPNVDEKRVVKCKAVPRLIREILPDEAFHINERKRKFEAGHEDKEKTPQEMFYQNLSLHPTMGEQIVLSVKRRRMANPINCKRTVTEVNICRYLVYFVLIFFISSSRTKIIHFHCNKVWNLIRKN